MPDIGTVESAVTIARWLKAVGDHVAIGEPLVEVETDKGVNPIESVASGVLLGRLYPEGQSVEAGTVIAWVGSAGEQIPKEAAATAAPTASAQQAPAAASPRSRIPTVVRALAERYGIDPATLTPTGAGGTVTRQDVLAARGAAPVTPPLPPAPPASAPAPLSANQAAVARVVTKSHREKPTFTVTMAVDMTSAIASRAAHTPASPWDAVFIRAAARAIAAFPAFRRWMNGELLREHAGIDVAFAVGVGGELFAPVIRGADRKDLDQIGAEVESLAGRARAHELTQKEAADSCFLVSNLGQLPVERFDAIVYPEHAAALAVGAITPTVVAGADGALRARPIVHLTLTVDHRLAGGLAAARMLAMVKETLEHA